MFSRKEKEFIARKVEEILLALNHPKMPFEKPRFVMSVFGREGDVATVSDNHIYRKD
jgi:hypothetical protein